MKETDCAVVTASEEFVRCTSQKYVIDCFGVEGDVGVGRVGIGGACTISILPTARLAVGSGRGGSGFVVLVLLHIAEGGSHGGGGFGTCTQAHVLRWLILCSTTVMLMLMRPA